MYDLTFVLKENICELLFRMSMASVYVILIERKTAITLWLNDLQLVDVKVAEKRLNLFHYE